MHDYIYIYDKKTFEKTLFGEIQSNFNIGDVIDGTKDSLKVNVLSFNGALILPNTIVWHENTNTWWVVSHASNERHLSENNDFLYLHDLQLLGAIELLNMRDLTDSGFNQDTYTIDQFIKRLFSLTEFNLPLTINYGNNLDSEKLVDYLKTYENYTCLRALRDFLDGYNCVAKLSFTQDSVGITGATLNIHSKTGDYSLSTYDENIFKDVKESKSLDKNSYGTTVVSNAENVVSTKTKTFPTTGGVRPSATSFTITPSNAIVRLPSNAFKVNYIDIVRENTPVIIVRKEGTGDISSYRIATYNPKNDSSISATYQNICDYLTANYGSVYADSFMENFNKNEMAEFGSYRIHNVKNYDPVNYTYISDYPLLKRMVPGEGGGLTAYKSIALANKDLKDNVDENNNEGTMYYERGKDTISNFILFNANSSSIYYQKLFIEKTNERKIFEFTYQAERYLIYIGNVSIADDTSSVSSYQELDFFGCVYVVNYVPMSDIKIKLDNSNDSKDSQFYNQNGKLNDSNSLSKMLLSYVKEITSDNITKYGTFYDYTQVPKSGAIVNIGNTPYVINSVSMDFYQNEIGETEGDKGYYIECEFTLSKNIAVKSLMVNPNRNIRDYGIPQNNNVKRKQLYRNFFELNHSSLSNETPYQTLDKILNVGELPQPYNEHITVIKLTYDNAFGNYYEDDDGTNTPTPSNTWYYQLETTTYIFKKTICEVVDFKDNNIIGYGSQNVWCGFVISRIFSSQVDTINTPISYVDDYGNFESIDIAFCTNEQLTEIYDNYRLSKTGGSAFDGSLYNYSVFISSEIYEGVEFGFNGAKDECDFIISEPNYNKDALEVPVFEYFSQIDDTDQVVVGENCLEHAEDNLGYLYSYYLVERNKVNENNYGVFINEMVVDFGLTGTAELNSNENSYGACKLRYTTNDSKLGINLTFYDIAQLRVGEWEEATYQDQKPVNNISGFNTHDIVVIRHAIKDNEVVKSDLLMIIRDTNHTEKLNNGIFLYINNYKLR